MTGMAPSWRVGPGAVPLLLTAGFAVVAVMVEQRGALPGDTRALLELDDLVGHADQPALVAIDTLTDLVGLAVVAVAALLGLLLVGRTREVVFFALGVAGVWVLNPVHKDLFERPRPDLWPSPVPVSELSFPSGHAANTAALVVALVLALPAGRWRRVAVVVGVPAVVAVAFSQLALGLHYPSDILAGWLWAGAWVSCVWSVHTRWRRRREVAAVMPRRCSPRRSPPPTSPSTPTCSIGGAQLDVAQWSGIRNRLHRRNTCGRRVLRGE